MRRVARWLFNAAATVSLLLLVAAGGLWVACRQTSRSVTFRDGTSAEIALKAYRGHRADVSVVRLVRLPRAVSDEPGRQRWLAQHPYREFQFAGIRCGVRPTYDTNDAADSRGTWMGIGQYLLLPFGWLIGVTALTPAAWIAARGLLRWRRGRRRAANLCRACGYDLTGNVSGVCPECGTPTLGPER